MKNHIQNMRTVLLVAGLMTGLLAGCSLFSKNEEAVSNRYRPDGENEYSTVNEKYSLSADRKKLDEIRSQIPEDKRRENDELAFMMEIKLDPKTGSRTPEQIRRDFDSTLRKKREQFNKDMQKEREAFTKEERKKRDAFLKAQNDQRNDFKKTKMSREQTAEFFKNADEKRKDFFANEREKRNDYESDVRERRKNFEDYMRAKQNDFSQEYRAYNKKYDDIKKQMKDQGKKNSQEILQFDKEFQEIQNKPSSQLGSGSGSGE